MEEKHRNRIISNLPEGILTMLVIMSFIIVFIIGLLLAIYIAIKFHNYFLLSFIIYLWITMKNDVSFKIYPEEREKVKIKYPYSKKILFLLIMAVTLFLSWKYFCACIIFIISCKYYTKLRIVIKEGLLL